LLEKHVDNIAYNFEFSVFNINDFWKK